MSAIQFLKRKEIDEQKWNESIARASSSLPYAFSWYLDAVAENWDALITDNYETVMPLVWLRKFGIKCLYQPYYCQQLGVFGRSVTKQVQQDFVNHIAEKFSYISINLNPVSKIVSEEYKLRPKKNLLLELSKDYNSLKKKYSENHRRNIKKAETAGIFFSDKTELKHFQKFYLSNVNRKQEIFKSKHEKIFKQLTAKLIEKNAGQIFSAIDEAGNLVAASIIVTHQKRFINVINTSSAQGKNTGASHFLFDKIIQKYAGTDNFLDFEGSSIPSIARFYQGFGAYEEIFYHYYTSVIEKQKQRFL